MEAPIQVDVSVSHQTLQFDDDRQRTAVHLTLLHCMSVGQKLLEGLAIEGEIAHILVRHTSAALPDGSGWRAGEPIRGRQTKSPIEEIQCQ